MAHLDSDFVNNIAKEHTLESINNNNKNDKTKPAELQTTETNMRVELLANSEKLITEDRRWKYGDAMSNEQARNSPVRNNMAAVNNTKIDTKEQPTKGIFNKKVDNNDNANNVPTITETAKKQDEPVSDEEMILLKLDMLRKLAELVQISGVKLSQNYNMQSDYKMMKYEYDLHKNVKSKQNGINWMSSMYLNLCYGLEMGNDKYNPFDLKLKGWSEQMNADISSYHDVFGEIYEKYNQPGKNMAPELKLLLMVSGSALKFHLTNTMMGGMPTLNDAMNKNPDLAQQMRDKALAANAAKMREQTIKNNDALQNNMDKEHLLAAQKAADIQMIRQREMDQLNAQRNFALKKTEMDKLHQGLTMNINDSQPILQPPSAVQNMMNNKPNSEQIKIANAYQQQQTEVYKKQLEALDAQKKVAEITSLRMEHEHINELERIKVLKKEQEKIKQSEGKNIDTMSFDSRDSKINFNNDLDKILNKSKDDLNRKIENSASKLSDSRITAIDTVDEEEISLGGKSKKSSKSKASNKSSKTTVAGRKIKNNKIGLSIL